MFLSSPVWLLALIPWTALFIWMFRGERSSVSVPFLHLWRAELHAARARRSLVPPSFPVIAILLALLLAILVGSGPRLRSRFPSRPITIIVDRGLTMMPEARSTPTLQRANRALLNTFSASSSVRLVAIPGGQVLRTHLSDWLSQTLELPEVPIATDSEMERAVVNARSEPLIVAITDKTLDRAMSNLIQFSPDPIRNNIAIVSVGAREGASAELMVRIRNNSDLDKATLRVNSGALVMNREITLPPRGQEQNFFLPAATLASTVEATLLDQDEFPRDNTAWLARERAFPNIRATPGVGADVQRVIKVFQKTHPAPNDGTQVLVAPAQSSELIADVTIATLLQPLAASALEVAAHPVTANLAITSLANLSVAGASPNDWLPLIRAGGRTLLSVRDTSRRQVWIGFTAENFSATADFVVLWTNILNWLSNTSDEFVSNPLAPLSKDWQPLSANAQSSQSLGLWPGIYRSRDGRFRAHNISPAIFPTSPAAQSSDIRGSLTHTGAIDASEAILLLILALLLLGAFAWPSQRLTRPSRAS